MDLVKEKILIVIKGSSVRGRICWKILKAFEEEYFEILHLEKLDIDDEQVSKFYPDMVGKEMFSEYASELKAGIAIILQREKGYEVGLRLIGSKTIPWRAEVNSLRHSIGMHALENETGLNGVHFSKDRKEFEEGIDILKLNYFE